MNCGPVTRTVTCQSLQELWLHVLYRCNLQCRHCLFSCSPEKESYGELSMIECREYVEAAMAQGVKAVYLTGGEPLLWTGLPGFLEWYYRRDKAVPLTILTNGTLIDAKTAGWLARYTGQGLVLRVSLECYTPGNHDDYRGTGNFARAIKGIKHLNNEGITPWIAYVNKSGGSLDSSGTRCLENDFRTSLAADYRLKIAGLKVIAAYAKGRFNGCVSPEASPDQVAERAATVQCNFGIAVSKAGIFPCPILVDVPEARLSVDLAEVHGTSYDLHYEYCNSCFATGTSCGQ
ncbi:MAG: radical SAM protein [Thermincola sp.]|nr:radical SAM protein [Thermincola sp.]MDT3702386.1 radical SAM protein [Thermincola sp.]